MQSRVACHPITRHINDLGTLLSGGESFFMIILPFTSNYAYQDKYFLYQYNDNNFRIVHHKFCKNKGYEEIKDLNDIDTNDFIDLNIENINSLKSSISRSKRFIREYVLSNDFEYFVTLTINSANADRFSLTECQELLRKTLKSFKRKNYNFEYVLITEKHENGAFHFHGFFKGINQEDLTELNFDNYEKLPIYIQDWIKKGEKIYSLKHFEYKMGFCTLSKIKHLAKASNYILKYITKDCIRNEKGSLYICSRGLKKATTDEIVPIDLSIFGDKVHSTEYTDILDYNLDELTQDQKLYLQYNIIHKENIFEKISKCIDF